MRARAGACRCRPRNSIVPGKQRRHCGRGCERCDALLRNSREVIRRNGAELSGKLRRSVRLQLISVELDTKTRAAGRRQNRARLLEGENARLAEDISKAGKLLARYSRQDLVEKQADVIAAPRVARAVLHRNLVRAKPGGNESQREVRGETRDDSQRLQLIVERQAVSRLDLDRCRAERSELENSRSRERVKLVFRSPAQIRN